MTQEVIELLEDNITKKILELFKQVITAQYQLHLFNLELSFSFDFEKNKEDGERSKFQTYYQEQEKYARLGFKKELEIKVNTAQSELSSLINAVHKQSLFNQITSDLYPFSLNYDRVKALCFTKVKHINERYNQGRIDPYHSHNIPTVGLKFEQKNVHFDPHYYYGALHKYFNQVECSQINYIGDSNGISHFSFQYLIYPLFYLKSGNLKTKKDVINAVFDAYFSSVGEQLEKIGSPSYIQRYIPPSEKELQVLSKGKKRRLRTKYRSAFLFKSYEPILITSECSSETFAKKISQQYFDNYNAENHIFKDSLETSIPSKQDKVLFTLPIQFVFNTNKAFNNLKIHNRMPYTGVNYLVSYLMQDRTGFWIDRLLLDYLKLNGSLSNSDVAQTLSTYSANMSYVELLQNIAAGEYQSYQDDAQPVKDDIDPINNYPNAQFSNTYLNAPYIKYLANKLGESDYVKNVTDTISSRISNIRAENSLSMVYQQSEKMSQIENTFANYIQHNGMSLSFNSIWDLLEQLFNQLSIKNSEENLKQLEMFEVGGVTLLPELTFNYNEYIWLCELFSSAYSILDHNEFVYNQVSSSLRKFDARLAKEKQELLKDNSSMMSYLDRPQYEIKPIVVFSLTMGDEYLDISIDDLIFDSDMVYSNLNLNINVFLDNPFSDKEMASRMFNIKPRLDKVIYHKRVLLNQSSYEILQSWRTMLHYLEFSLRSSGVITALHKRFDSYVLNSKTLEFIYKNTDGFDIMVSMNI